MRKARKSNDHEWWSFVNQLSTIGWSDNSWTRSGRYRSGNQSINGQVFLSVPRVNARLCKREDLKRLAGNTSLFEKGLGDVPLYLKLCELSVSQ